MSTADDSREKDGDGAESGAEDGAAQADKPKKTLAGLGKLNIPRPATLPELPALKPPPGQDPLAMDDDDDEVDDDAPTNMVAGNAADELLKKLQGDAADVAATNPTGKEVEQAREALEAEEEDDDGPTNVLSADAANAALEDLEAGWDVPTEEPTHAEDDEEGEEISADMFIEEEDEAEEDWDEFGEEKTEISLAPMDFLEELERDKQAASVRPSTGEQPAFEPQQPTPEAKRNPAPQPQPEPDVSDFEDQKTEMLVSPFESDPVRAKFTVLEGPCYGQEFFVSQARNTLGRGTNNTIVVADLAMSRQHIEVIRNPDESFTIRDLNSVNGTIVNGTKVKESDLFHGDRVEAGKTVMQFIVTGAQPSAGAQRRVVPAAYSTLDGAPMPGGAGGAATADANLVIFRYVTIIATVLCIAMTGVIGWLLYLKSNSTPAVAAEDKATTLYLEGVDSVRSKDWKAAQVKFELAATADPALDVKSQLERISSEQRAERSLKAAADLVDKGRPDLASKKVAEIPRDSVYYTDGRELLRKKRVSNAEDLYAKAEEAWAAKDKETALKHLEELLAAKPDHKNGQELKTKITGAEPVAIAVVTPTEDTPKETTPTPKTTDKPKTDKPKDDDWVGIGSSKPKTGGSSGLAKGYKLYKARSFSAAARHFDGLASAGGGDAAKAKKHASAVRKFEPEYNEGKSQFKARKWSKASKALLRAKKHDRAVNSAFSKEINQMLAASKAELGLSSLKIKQRAKAFKLYKDARNFDKRHSKVRQLRDKLEGEAQKLFIKASAAKKKNNKAEAAKHCRTILSMTPSDSPHHKKAKSMMSKL